MFTRGIGITTSRKREISSTSRHPAHRTEEGDAGSPSVAERLEIILNALVPGLLAGALLTGVLFFLNPQLPFEPVPALLGIGVYGGLAGLLSSLAVLPFTWRSRQRSRRWLPWLVTLVLGGVAMIAWGHAVRHGFLLPPGINQRLLKAAIWLSLGAVVGLYLALASRLRQRTPGRRSGILMLLLATVSIYVVFERRDSFKPSTEPSPRASVVAGVQRPHLCLVGLDSATLDALLPLAEQGRLPFFSRLLQEGSFARMNSQRPALAAPLWTTLATGKFPYQHGVAGPRRYADGLLAGDTSLRLLPLGSRFDPWALTAGSRRSNRLDRKVLALWQTLARLGVATGVLGWPLSSPPSKEIDWLLSERFFAAGASLGDAHPEELGEQARLFQIALSDLDPTVLSRFGEHPPRVVLESLAQDLWRRDLAQLILDREPSPGALLTLLPGLEAVSRQLYGGYQASRLDGLQDAAAEDAAQMIDTYYAHLDEILAQLWERTPAPRLMVVLSPRGIQGAGGWRGLWHQLLRRPAQRGYDHKAPDGVLMMMGEGITTGRQTGRAELVDVVPTILYALGFPVARDLDGSVLNDFFKTDFLVRQPLTFVPSYETLSADQP